MKSEVHPTLHYWSMSDGSSRLAGEPLSDSELLDELEHQLRQNLQGPHIRTKYVRGRQDVAEWTLRFIQAFRSRT